MSEKDGLTKKEKLAIVRDIIIRIPNYRKYGFNRLVIELFKEKHHIEITDSDISKYIKEVEDQWKEIEDNKTSKSQLKEMLFNVYEKNKGLPHAQIRSLQEIGKLEGYHKPDIINNNFNNFDPKDVKRMENIFGTRDNKNIKDKKD